MSVSGLKVVLSSFGGGRYVTAVTNYNQRELIVQSISKDSVYLVTPFNITGWIIIGNASSIQDLFFSLTL